MAWNKVNCTILWYSFLNQGCSESNLHDKHEVVNCGQHSNFIHCRRGNLKFLENISLKMNSLLKVFGFLFDGQYMIEETFISCTKTVISFAANDWPRSRQTTNSNSPHTTSCSVSSCNKIQGTFMCRWKLMI